MSADETGDAKERRRCAYCHDVLGVVVSAVCPLCETRLHLECLAHLARCPTIGCNADFQPAAQAARQVLDRPPAPVEGPVARYVHPAEPREEDPDDDPRVRARGTFDPILGVWRADALVGAGFPSATEAPPLEELQGPAQAGPLATARPTADGRCPTCQNPLEVDEDEDEPEFCFHCGEALATDGGEDDEDD